MNELKTILIRPQAKSVILALFTIAIGALTGIAVNNIDVWYWWLILGLTIIIYVVVLISYARLEESINSQLHEIKEKLKTAQQNVETFRGAFQGVNAICKLSAKQTNLKIHEIIEQGKIFCDNWNFEIASSLLCEQIYNHVISHICENTEYTGNADIEIEYVSLIEPSIRRKKKRTDQIKLCGYYHPSRPNPSIYRKIRNANQKGKDGKPFHDGSLFVKKKNAISILMTKKDIEGEEGFGSLAKNHDYSQYIGIPVFCDTADGDNKMVGLLEVVCHNNSSISSDEDRIRECIDLYLSTYASVFLLLFKNDKALRATPKHKIGDQASQSDQRIGKEG